MSASRRTFLAGVAAISAAPGILRAAGSARVTVVGGGFGGASIARALKARAPELSVTLIERDATFHTCPFSNSVIGGIFAFDRIAFRYDKVAAAGITVITDSVTAIHAEERVVSLAGGQRIESDFLILAPGIQFDWTAIEGYSASAAEIMPHAWQAGPQTALLRKQLEAMPDGGVVTIAIPAAPFRCPPGPYERICLIAHHLKTAKPKSKILVLDAQDAFSKQPLFEEAWNTLYPGLIERVPGSMSGRVRRLDTRTMTVSTDFDDHKTAVANIIPPQKASQILLDAGLDSGTGWCSVDPVSFESTMAKGVFILGDASLAGDMPKSGFSANVQAKACADAIISQINGSTPQATKLVNVCYSLASPDYGFSIADVFIPKPDKITLLERDGRTTKVGATAHQHRLEAEYARSWYGTITREMFG